jgi:hypothetical protein
LGPVESPKQTQATNRIRRFATSEIILWYAANSKRFLKQKRGVWRPNAVAFDVFPIQGDLAMQRAQLRH